MYVMFFGFHGNNSASPQQTRYVLGTTYIWCN